MMNRPAIPRILGLFALLLAFSATAAAQEASGKLKENVAALQKRGFMSESDVNYWVENAAKGRQCDGGKVGELIVACVASKSKKVKTLDEACDYLESKKILGKTAYWKKYAVAGKSCEGAGTSVLIARLERLTR
ncbi:hypothetical protein OH491_27055 [Termitidicoccus mucosus]|jgi:hypothetical protein|uniref:Uncharacterized protein n=1 Tax=Termitidicoccus mucosus TaxID=1184151 RepID=A0A178IE07_9BACT|nr:hypothetical protein AW736_23710 [Opitutaceae bacterium TSB47]